MIMEEPLTALSSIDQNTQSVLTKVNALTQYEHAHDLENIPPRHHDMNLLNGPTNDDTSIIFDFTPSPHKATRLRNPELSPIKSRSPVKYRLQDGAATITSPPASPMEQIEPQPGQAAVTGDTILDEGMSSIPHPDTEETHVGHTKAWSDGDTTGPLDHTVQEGITIGDLSTISAIPTDLTHFAKLRQSPIKNQPHDGFTPRPSQRNTIAVTPMTGQRPLQLLSRRSTSSNEEDDATPRRRLSQESPTDLLNFTGQTHLVFPPPASAPRAFRRSPSGRGAFPVRTHATPAHRSQASVDREGAARQSPQKSGVGSIVPSTPATGGKHIVHPSVNGFGTDLLDLDLGPMATPRSIPTVTPRELETLRSELQSRISGLEATLSGREAEIVALKKSIVDAETRAGKASEELHTERADKEELLTQRNDLDRRTREMEEVLREVKQNAFVEEREREKLRRQAEEAERKTEECEVKILELNAALETLRSDRINLTSPLKSAEPSTPGQGSPIDIDAAVKNATETVARELHTLYKSKHERKVTDLKLSYEKRWIKQVDNLKAELEASQGQVTSLLAQRDGAGLATAAVSSQTEAVSKMGGQIEELRRYNEDLSTQKKLSEAECAGLRSELDMVRRDNDLLQTDLERARVEQGELVAQVDLFLAASAEQEQRQQEARETRERHRQPVSPPRSDASGELLSHSAGQIGSPLKSRPAGGPGASVAARPRPMSMLAQPAPSKIGSGIPGPGTSGLKPPGSGVPNRNGIYMRGNLMGGITRMGTGSR